MPGRPRVAGSRRAAPPHPAPTPQPAPAAQEPVGGVPERIVVGRLGRPQGIKGELTVEVRTDDPDDRFAVGKALHTDPSDRGPVTIAGARRQGRYFVVQLEGVHDRNQAEELRDTLLLVDVADLPPIEDDDEYYDTQLIGLAAQLEDGTRVGEVTDVLHLPGGDTLVVQREHGSEALIPFVRTIVPTVDLGAGTLTLTPPDGLLDLSEA